MPVPKKDFNEILKKMGKKSAKEFVKASSAKSNALDKKMTRSADRDANYKHKAYNEAQEVMRRARNG